MIEVYPNLWVGNQQDYESVKHEDMFFVLAAKEPWHREELGYTSRGAPKDEDYFFALRGNRLILNLVDAQEVKYIPSIVIDKALGFIEKHIKEGRVGIFCNEGRSRSPSIAFLYLLKLGVVKTNDDFLKLFPAYDPGKGMRDFVDLAIFSRGLHI